MKSGELQSDTCRKGPAYFELLAERYEPYRVYGISDFASKQQSDANMMQSAEIKESTSSGAIAQILASKFSPEEIETLGMIALQIMKLPKDERLYSDSILKKQTL